MENCGFTNPDGDHGCFCQRKSQITSGSVLASCAWTKNRVSGKQLQLKQKQYGKGDETNGSRVQAKVGNGP